MLVDKNNPQDTILLKQDNSQSNQEEVTTMSSSYKNTTPIKFYLNLSQIHREAPSAMPGYPDITI